jgi:hypothetical protein
MTVSDSLQAHRRNWISNVFGVTFTPAEEAPEEDSEEDSEETPAPVRQEPFAVRWQPVKEAWTEAIFTAEQQLAALGKLLRASTDPRLQQIAEFGLGAITAGHKVAVMAAVREVAADPVKALPKALQAVGKFRAHIEGDDRVAACDQNPFGAPVTLRATLGEALARMEAVLARG